MNKLIDTFAIHIWQISTTVIGRIWEDTNTGKFYWEVSHVLKNEDVFANSDAYSYIESTYDKALKELKACFNHILTAEKIELDKNTKFL